MTDNRLNIVATEDTGPLKSKRTTPTKATKRVVAKATFDRLWLIDPNQFNPLSTCLGRDRVKKTKELILSDLNDHIKIAADLGTGSGIFSLFLNDNGRTVHAVDIATIPLENLKDKNRDNLLLFQDYVPHTTLESDSYDLVLGLDLIAYLKKEEYRLFFAELCRLVKLEGLVIASTPIDIYSEDALSRFAELAETEFAIDAWVFSYHGFFLRLLSFFKAPAIFVKASKDKQMYEEELKKRFSITKFIFKINSSKPISYFWQFVSLLTNPIVNFLKQNQFIMLQLEKICRFISAESGISHAIFVGKRRKLFESIEKDKEPVERKGKRQVWE